jgi:hypothetical protein
MLASFQTAAALTLLLPLALLVLVAGWWALGVRRGRGL